MAAETHTHNSRWLVAVDLVGDRGTHEIPLSAAVAVLGSVAYCDRLETGALSGGGSHARSGERTFRYKVILLLSKKGLYYV